MENYPKVSAVYPLPGKHLRVTCANGETRAYDCTPLLGEPAFAVLRDDAVFRNVHVDEHGYGISWNDNVDLAESELWVNGTTEPAGSESH
ncbi:MAG: DUF2442 domain-containing protein [Thermodesulfobacteriota bacterium]